MSISLRDGNVYYAKGEHNHLGTYSASKHGDRRCEVDMRGKYKITGKWTPTNALVPATMSLLKTAQLKAYAKKRDDENRVTDFCNPEMIVGKVHSWHVPTFEGFSNE